MRTRAREPHAPTSIVAVDFGPVGMGRPLEEMLSAAPHWLRSTRVVDPLDHRWCAGEGLLGRHADRVATDLLCQGLAPAAIVLGQCAGAMFALDLADKLEQGGCPPAAVALVEPVLVTTDFFNDHVRKLMARLGGHTYSAARGRDLVLEDGNAAEVIADLKSRLSLIAERQVADLGLDESGAEMAVSDIVDLYINWICFLASQRNPRKVELTAPVHLVGSVTQETVDALQGPAVRSRAVSWPPASRPGTSSISEHLADVIVGAS